MPQNFVHERSYESRWKLLEAATARLDAAGGLPEIVDIVRSTARGIMSADGVTFVMREGDKCHYVDEDAIGQLWKGQRFPMVSCISGWAMLNGKTVAIPDVFNDPRIPLDVYRRTFVKSMVMAPVGLPDPFAAVGAYWRDKRDCSPREIETVEALAGAVAAAMRNAGAA
jgi:GAF domain-containing protein